MYVGQAFISRALIYTPKKTENKAFKSLDKTKIASKKIQINLTIKGVIFEARMTKLSTFFSHLYPLRSFWVGVHTFI